MWYVIVAVTAIGLGLADCPANRVRLGFARDRGIVSRQLFLPTYI